MENQLFINYDDIISYTSVSSNIDPNKLTAHIYNAQILYIEPILGSTLYEKMEDLISTGDINISQYTNYYNLLYNYITPSVVFHTLELFIPLNAFQLTDGGVSQHTFSNANYSPLTDIEKISQKYRTIGSKYDDKLVAYLDKNKDLFTEYINQDGLIKKTETTQRTGLYIGSSTIRNKIRS